MKMKKNDQILIVAAHPDDEILGCGGTISRHIDQNNEVSDLFLTDGVSSRDNTLSNENIKDTKHKRKDAALSVSKFLKYKNLIFGSFPDNKCDTIYSTGIDYCNLRPNRDT